MEQHGCATDHFFIHIGDPAQPPPPENRKNIRNHQWKHMYIDDILSMPDNWEYPFLWVFSQHRSSSTTNFNNSAAWDTAFHAIPLAMIDPEFAKKQLDLLTREWYMHPNGQVRFLLFL